MITCSATVTWFKDWTTTVMLIDDTMVIVGGGLTQW